MVHGETYYSKFSTDISIDLSAYLGTYELRSAKGSVVQSGNMVKNTHDFELTIQTSTLDRGDYRLVCLVTFPDGFIQAINDESVYIN